MDHRAQLQSGILAPTGIAEADPLHRDVEAIARIDAVPMILDVICRTTGMGFAAVARVTDERWIACAIRDGIGFPIRAGDEVPLEMTVCNDVRCFGRPVVLDDVSRDDAYRDHPTLKGEGLHSYISMPIRRPSGDFFGTLCAVDRRARFLNTPHVVGMFELFADLIGFHLNMQDRLSASETALLNERETAQLREQFVAVLGHDLRNPLTSIQAGVGLLQQRPPAETAHASLVLIGEAVRRMEGLIDNVLDFARGRLGGGFEIARSGAPLEPVLRRVLGELQSIWPQRLIEADLEVPGPVECDPVRIGQLFSKLLGNALSHGATDEPVLVRASLEDGAFALSVANGGEPIPQDIEARLFRPFYRQSGGRERQGLGLGLFIAAEIARAHGGALTMESTTEETRFTFKMPIRSALSA